MIFIMFLNITFLINVEETPPPPLPPFMSAAISAIELYCPEKRFFLNFFFFRLENCFCWGWVSPTYMVTVPVSDWEPDKPSFNFFFL